MFLVDLQMKLQELKQLRNYVDNVAETIETELTEEMAKYLGGEKLRGRREIVF
jgi:hypothetical protein